MRVEAHGIGSVMHVIKRGGRGMEICRDDDDRKKFVRSLFYLNDEYVDPYWMTTTSALKPPHKPDHWLDRKPLVEILAWTLMSNHFHLLLKEITDGGMASFMQGLCGSMSKQYNNKYDEVGSIFQGGYRGKLIDNDDYLRYVLPYIVVKNVFELYPGGLAAAVHSFEKAWQWALAYPYSSLRTHAKGEKSPILAMDMMRDMFESGVSFKKQAHDMLTAHAQQREIMLPHRMQLETW
jgi:putative transposase